LVADDDAFAQTILSGLFKTMGVEVMLAEDGKKALDLYTGCNGAGLSYILMDIHMPILDGYDVKQ
jgi:CheY-like chemotaxis protein